MPMDISTHVPIRMPYGDISIYCVYDGPRHYGFTQQQSQAQRPKEEKRAADGREFAEDAANDEVLKNITRQAPTRPSLERFF